MIRTRSTAVLLHRRACRSAALREALRDANERAAQLERELSLGVSARGSVAEAFGAGVGATLARALFPRSSSTHPPTEAR